MSGNLIVLAATYATWLTLFTISMIAALDLRFLLGRELLSILPLLLASWCLEFLLLWLSLSANLYGSV